MSFVRLRTRADIGLDAPAVSVEVHISGGLPSFSIVGLPEAAVRESRERVRSAILNSGFDFPPRRITVNLAPADLPKQGGRFDLPIALGILAATNQLTLTADALSFECLGELGLDGALKSVPGVLPAAIQINPERLSLLLPSENFREASLVEGLRLLPAANLCEAVAHLSGEVRISLDDRFSTDHGQYPGEALLDFSQVRGQTLGRRVLEIAAAGGHSLVMVGPPGCGKTMLAERLPTILPPLSVQEALEVAAIQSIAWTGFDPELWRRRPFRAPHHSASAVALTGGGSRPQPGEISLAHRGVLFLDELSEFPRYILDQLREPLESGVIRIARASRSVVFPCRFQWIGAMNPCLCGYEGDTSGRCKCTPDQVRRYWERLSGPLLDRIDLQVRLPTLSVADVTCAGQPVESSEAIAARVQAARDLQLNRAGAINALMSVDSLEQHCALSGDARHLFEQAVTRLGFSARSFHRILRVARTIADLDGSSRILSQHVGETLQYRLLDRPSP